MPAGALCLFRKRLKTRLEAGATLMFKPVLCRQNPRTVKGSAVV
jgi:hypothetical protein